MSKRTTRSLLGALALLLALFAMTGTAWATTFSNPVDANYSHIDNSVYLSQADFPDGAPAAVLAGSESYTNALTATVLAKAANGPLLLTSSTGLSQSVQDELVRLNVTKVFIVGLSTTIVNQVKAALPALTAGQVVALAGADIYQTAALVAGKVKELRGGTPERVFIVPGDVYGSSLAAAAVAAANGWPLLLTPQAGPFPSSSAQAIVDLGVKNGVRVDTSADPGVSGFTVDKTIMGTTSTTDDPGARYTEALAVAQYAAQQGWATYAHLALGEEEGGSVACSVNFPDNVLLASHIAREDGAYLLARSTALQSSVADFLRAQGKAIDSVDFMRPDYANVSSSTWSFATIRQVKSLNSPRVTGLSKTSGPLGGGGALTITGSGFTGTTAVRTGKTDLPDGSWHVNSDTSITIDSMPAATQPGAMEILVSNYWYVNPSNPSDAYFYVDSGPQLAAMSVVQEAVKYLGVPYVWAGATTSGFDCSGLTMYVYNKFTAQTGVTLPHKSTYQASYGTAVDKEDLLPGDLVFFESPIAHVGIYVGNGLMINSPRSGDLVTIEDVYRTDFATARRLISPYTRVQETSTLLAYTGSWSKGTASSASGGGYSYADSDGSSVTMTFTGIYAQWLAKKSPSYGLASVSVDGGAPVSVDLYSPSASYVQKAWDTGLLASGTHTVTIQWTGGRNPSATDANIGLDAFDVIGTVVQAHAPGMPTRYQDTDTRVTYSGLWDGSTVTSASGGCFRRIDAAGSASVTFTGTYLSWVATKGPGYGIAKLTVDGQDAGTVDLYNAGTSYSNSVWNTGTLAVGTHTVSIAWTGNKNASSADASIDLDAFDILGSPVAPSGVTRYEQSYADIAYSGTWTAYSGTGPSSGDYKRANASGASVTVAFTGTYLSWIATAGTTLGKAFVSLDGGAAQSIDLARSAVAYQQSVWATGTLSSGPHSVKIWWDTGNQAGKFISVDAFDVVGTITGGSPPPPPPPPPPSSPVRYQETDTRIVYTGLWENSAVTPASGGSLRYIDAAGSASITFQGTYLAWIAKKSPVYGIAKVTVDGQNAGTVDLYSTSTSYLNSVWNTGTLADGTHTVKIERTTSKNAAATDYNLGLDAFDIVGTPVTPAGLTRHEESDQYLHWAGAWTPYYTGSASAGTYLRANTSGASVTVNFSGTYLSWIATAGTTVGLASVSLDGGPAQSVDLSRAAVAYQQSVWATGVLASGAHTVKISWAANSTGKFISIDAFDVIGTLQ